MGGLGVWRAVEVQGSVGGHVGTVVVKDGGGENGATHMCSAVGQVYMGVL